MEGIMEFFKKLFKREKGSVDYNKSSQPEMPMPNEPSILTSTNYVNTIKNDEIDQKESSLESNIVDETEKYESVVEQKLEFDNSSNVLNNVISINSSMVLAVLNDGRVAYSGNLINVNDRFVLDKWTDIVSVAIGIGGENSGSFFAGLKRDGSVVTLTHDDTLSLDVSNWRNIIAISAGTDFLLGLRSDGTVSATGNNNCNQLCVENWKDIERIAAGDDFSFGLKADGTIIFTGDDTYGFSQVAKWTNIVDISASVTFIAGLKDNGEVVLAGHVNSVSKDDMSKLKNIIAISAGLDFVVGLNRNGKVIAVGDNSEGQCNVRSWSGITGIAADPSYTNRTTIGIKKDGTLIAVGDNTFNQCDLGHINGVAIPKRKLLPLVKKPKISQKSSNDDLGKHEVLTQKDSEGVLTKQQISESISIPSVYSENEPSVNIASDVLYPIGMEPANILKRMKLLFEKLDSAYPDKVIIGLYTDHKKWSESMVKIYRQLGYSDSTSFLNAYGYSVEMKKTGRPVINHMETINELKRRYSNGATCSNVGELKNQNLDLSPSLKSLQNRSKEYFGLSLKNYLIQEGIILDKKDNVTSAVNFDNATENQKGYTKRKQNVSSSNQLDSCRLDFDSELIAVDSTTKEILKNGKIYSTTQNGNEKVSKNKLNKDDDNYTVESNRMTDISYPKNDTASNGNFDNTQEKVESGMNIDDDMEVSEFHVNYKGISFEVEFQTGGVLFWLLMKMESIKNNKTAYYSKDGKKLSPTTTNQLMADFVNICNYVSYPENLKLLVDRAVKKKDGKLFTNRVEYFCHSGLYKKVKSDFGGEPFYYDPFALRIKNWTSDKMEIYLDSYESKFNAPTASEYVDEYKEAVNQYLSRENIHFNQAKELAEIFINQFKYSFEEYAQGATFRFWKYITIEKYINDEKIVHIPFRYDGIGTSISPGAFANKNIVELHMEGKIGDVNDRAFENCRNLERIYLPKSIEYISEKAFLNCNYFEMIASNKLLKPLEDYSRSELPRLIGTKQYSNLNWICNYKYGDVGKSHQTIDETFFEEGEVSTADERKLDSSMLLAATFCYEPFELPSKDKLPAKYRAAWNELFSAAIAMNSLAIVEKLAPLILTSRNKKRFIEQAKSTNKTEVLEFLSEYNI